MLEIDKRLIDFSGSNSVKTHTIELDDELHAVIAVSVKDKNIEDLVYGKIVDSLIDAIHPKNVYKDFQNILENVNAFLETLSGKENRIKWIHAFIGIYHKKTLFFSTVWKASCYLYNVNNDVIEVTDKTDTPHVFSHILSGEIASGESLIIATHRLLDTLSKDDLRESFIEQKDIHTSWDMIGYILEREDIGKNIWYILLRKTFQISEASQMERYYESVKYFFLKILDNDITKKTLWYLYILKDKIFEKSKKTQQKNTIASSTKLCYICESKHE